MSAVSCAAKTLGGRTQCECTLAKSSHVGVTGPSFVDLGSKHAQATTRQHEPRAILFSDSRWAWTPSTAVGCAPPRASPPRASPPRTCHLVPATSIRAADAAPRPSAMVSAMESAMVSAITSAVTSAQPLTPCTDSASTPRQMQSWGTAPRMPRRRAVVSACMQGRSSVAISVPGPRMPRRRAGAP